MSIIQAYPTESSINGQSLPVCCDLQSILSGGPTIDPGQRPPHEVIDEMVEWLRVFAAKDQVVELRALNVREGRFKMAKSGFFDAADHLEDMASEALGLTYKAEGVYFTLNPLDPALLSRRSNRIDVAENDDAAADKDVVRRRWLLIDADPVRPSGISSSDSEKHKAHQRVLRVRQHLRGCGWPDPILADSGNGFHLLYRVDLPAQDSDLVKNVLTSLAKRFDDDGVKVDQKVFNPARIVKLYGTIARKGDDTEDRPHRWTSVLEKPGVIQVVPVGLLEELAAEVTDEPSTPLGSRTPASSRTYSIGPEQRKQRARAYLEKVPGAISGQGGHDATFHAACVLVRGFDVPVNEALPVLQGWNAKCQPPWTDKELMHKLQDAEKQPGPRGYLLGRGDPESIPDDEVGSAAGIETKADGSIMSRVAYDDPHRLAELVAKNRYIRAGTLELRYWRGQWWRWEGSLYRVMADDELKGELWADLRCEFERINIRQLARRAELIRKGERVPLRPPVRRKVNTSLVSNVSAALISQTQVPGVLEQPVWVPDNGVPEKRNYIALGNGLLRVDDLLAKNTNVLDPASPRWFSPVCLPYNFDPKAICPKWDAILERNLEGDQKRIDLLQEWFGYCLVPDTSLQKFLVLEGEGCNGKSVVCAVLTAMLGEANVSHVPLEAFGQRFALTQTLGKLANIASEVGELDKAAEGLLKSFTSGDRMMFDRKGIDPVEAMPTARLVLATNNRPRFSDRSGGLWRRMLLVPFQVEILPHERIYGMDKPGWWVDSGELPGIFNWAIEGLRRLRQQRRFTEPAICADALDQYRAECNPARSFLLETCTPTPGSQVPVDNVYEAYREWCQRNGYQPLGAAAFGKEFFRVLPKARKKRTGPRTGRIYVYDGVQYQPAPRSLW